MTVPPDAAQSHGVPHPAPSSSSVIKLLITTDNHLGYAERDPRRGDDSFTTFEEVLRAARVEHDVDAVLLGGDLFHENKPSLGCLARSCSLFHKYVLGDKPIHLSLLSDPAKNFPTHAVPLANFQDPNINVALPVFAIHGNHDDPVGGTSALDVLSTNGYINYFGHVPSLEDVVVEPVLLRKGSTYVALYGLGNVRDERLHRCFQLKKIHFVHPVEVPGRKWFSILVLHQNRGVRGYGNKAGVFEHMLAGLGMDVVVWGNEHEQMMVPQPSHGFDVIQPGSTILTSLTGSECNPKQYGIMEIRGTSYRLTPYPLRSVRPVVRRTIELRHDHPNARTLDAVEDFLRSVVEEMIEEAEEQVSHIPDDVLAFHPNIKYPLMRLAVDFTDAESAPFPQPNLNRFGQQYMDVIANPGDLLKPVLPKKERNVLGATVRRGAGRAGRGGGGGNEDAGDGIGIVPVAPQLPTLDIRAKVADVFNHGARDACHLLSEPEVSAAVYAFAEKGERDAIDERIVELLNVTQKKVWHRLSNGANDAILKPDVIAVEVERYKMEMNERYARAVALDTGVGGEDEDGNGDAEGNEVEGGDGDGRTSRQKQLSELFEVVQPPSPGAPGASSSAELHRAGGKESRGEGEEGGRRTGRGGNQKANEEGDGSEEDAEDDEGGQFGGRASVKDIMQDALFAQLHATSGSTLAGRRSSVHSVKVEPSTSSSGGGGDGGNHDDPPQRGANAEAEKGDDEEEALEELPGDELDRCTVDALVAQVTGGVSSSTSIGVAGGLPLTSATSRPVRSGVTTSRNPVGKRARGAAAPKGLEEDSAMVVDVDDDDDGAPPPPRSTTRRLTSRTTDTAPRSTRRVARGGGSAAPLAGMPALPLAPDASASGSAPSRHGGTGSRKGVGSGAAQNPAVAGNGATLNLLSKWGSS